MRPHGQTDITLDCARKCNCPPFGSIPVSSIGLYMPKPKIEDIRVWRFADIEGRSGTHRANVGDRARGRPYRSGTRRPWRSDLPDTSVQPSHETPTKALVVGDGKYELVFSWLELHENVTAIGKYNRCACCLSGHRATLSQHLDSAMLVWYIVACSAR